MRRKTSENQKSKFAWRGYGAFALYRTDFFRNQKFILGVIGKLLSNPGDKQS